MYNEKFKNNLIFNQVTLIVFHFIELSKIDGSNA